MGVNVYQEVVLNPAKYFIPRAISFHMDYEVHNSIGVFRRLSAVSEMLAAADSGMYAGFTAFLRRQVNLIEALQYYVMDMRLNMLYKFLPLSKQQQFHCAGGLEAAPWVVAELAFSIMAGNRSQFILSDVMMAYMEDLLARCCFTSDMRSLFEFKLENEIPTSGHLYDQSCLVLLNNEKRSIVFESLHPPFLSLLKRDIQTEEYLSHNYGVAELMDEFDLLRDTDRDRFVSERIKYLLMELSKCCPYYRDKFNCSLIDLPVMNGLELSNRVPPYGSELISFDDTYAVAFATGGTTGRMKFVYRNDWEDKENARYLAKGLFSQGLKSTDVVFNCLSGGFWGGSHVFLLALSFIGNVVYLSFGLFLNRLRRIYVRTGCSVVPLGIEFSNDDCIRYIDQLKPSAILALPSYIMTLAEHVHSTQKTTGEIKGLTKCITGGEMMLPAMKIKISEFLGINQFMSTGYTSNETGAIGFPCRCKTDRRIMRPHLFLMHCRFLPPNHFHIHENMQHVSIQSLDDTTSNERVNAFSIKTITHYSSVICYEDCNRDQQNGKNNY